MADPQSSRGHGRITVDPRNWARRHATLFGVLLSCLVAGALLAEEPLAPSAVLRDGLVFNDAQFLAGPYLLERSETGQAVEIIVAGMTLDRFSVREAVDRAPAGLAIPLPEYEIPEGVDTLRGSGYPAYLHRLLKHHAALVGLEEALALVEADATSCPLVDRVERDVDGLLLFDRTGDPYVVAAGADLVSPGLSREEALALADRTLLAYQAILSRGGAILHFHDADIFLPRVRVVDLLIPSLEILDDPTLARQDKRQRLQERWKNDGIVDELLLGYQRVPELWGALQVYATEGR